MLLNRLLPLTGLMLLACVAARPAHASIQATSTAEHTLTITSLSGNAADLQYLSMDAYLMDAFTDELGTGTSASATVTAGGAQLDRVNASAALFAGDSIVQSASASAQRFGEGISSATGRSFVDVEFYLDVEASEAVTITLTYNSSVSGEITGSSALEFGLTDAFTSLDGADFGDGPSQGWIIEAALDSLSGDHHFADSINGRTFSLILNPGDMVGLTFDASARANVNFENPEPVSLAIWGGLGLAGIACLQRRRRRRQG